MGLAGVPPPNPAHVPIVGPGPKVPKGDDRRYDRTVWLFFGPAAILLVFFLLVPTVYTFLLSFNRGRSGDFTEWVGLNNYVDLFKDKSFINFSTFPPSGAIWNNLLWVIFYVSLVIFLGLVVAVVTQRVRYEALIKAIV